MRLTSAILSCLVSSVWFFSNALPAQAQWAVATLRSVDHLIGDSRYVLRLAGQDEIARQMDGFLSLYLGKGLDTKRPLGIYLGDISETPPLVVFLPVTSESDLVELVTGFGLDISEADRGLRSLDLPTGQKLFLKFAQDYVFASENEDSLRGKLPEVADLIGQVGRDHLFAARLRFDLIPGETKAALLGKLDQDLQRDLARREGESETEHLGRQIGMRHTAAIIVELAKEGKEVGLTLNCDQARHLFNLELLLTANPGSELARGFNEFGSARSSFAALTSDAAASILLKLPFSGKLRKDLDQLLDAIFQEVLANEPSPLKKAIAEKIFQTVEPTLRQEALDAAVVMAGPLADDKFCLLGALTVKEGHKVEALIRDMIQQMPAEERRKANIRLDLSQVGEVRIHSFSPPEAVDDNFLRIFGQPQVFLAFRDDAVVVAIGEHAEEPLKKALSALGSGNASSSSPLRLEAKFEPLLGLLPADDAQRLREAMNSIDGDRRDDRLRIEGSGGSDSMRLRFQVSSRLLVMLVAAVRQPGP